MSYVKGEGSRGVGAIAARDNALGAIPAGALGVRPGLVPPRSGPAAATGIRMPSLPPMRPTPRPSNIRVAAPPSTLRPMAVVTAAGRPLAVVRQVPIPSDAARLSVSTGAPRKATVVRSVATPTRKGTVSSSAAAPRKGTVTSGPAAKKHPVWVDKASKCPKGYFIKKTVFKPSPTGSGGKMMFWCWPNPVSKPKQVVKSISAAKPTRKAHALPGAPRGGLKIGHLKVRGPVVAALGIAPGTTVSTAAGDALVVSTPAGPVAIPGAVAAPGVAPGSTVSTDAGPATVVDTPTGPVAVPESMAPPEQEWASDAMIDDLLGPTKDAVAAEMGPSAETQPGAPVVDEGPPTVATPAEQKDMKKGGVGKLAVVGGSAWLLIKFFL